MKHYSRIALSLLAVITLTACESWHYSRAGSSIGGMDWISGEDSELTPDSVVAVPEPLPVDGLPPQYAVNINQDFPQLADTSVEVFDFDEGNIAGMPMPVFSVPPYEQIPTETVFTGDPSVTVFVLPCCE